MSTNEPTRIQPAMVEALVTIAEQVLHVRKGGAKLYGDCVKTVTEVNNMLRLNAYREDVSAAIHEVARRANLLG